MFVDTETFIAFLGTAIFQFFHNPPARHIGMKKKENVAAKQISYIGHNRYPPNALLLSTGIWRLRQSNPDSDSEIMENIDAAVESTHKVVVIDKKMDRVIPLITVKASAVENVVQNSNAVRPASALVPIDGLNYLEDDGMLHDFVELKLKFVFF